MSATPDDGTVSRLPNLSEKNAGLRSAGLNVKGTKIDLFVGV
jgi:hypothetical protein